MATERDHNQDTQTSRAANDPGARGPDTASTGTDQSLWPLIEAFRVGDKFVVQADIPGMHADDVVVEITDAELIISGERVRSAPSEGQNDHEERDHEQRHHDQRDHQERSFGPFRRTVRLPEGAHRETVRATVENGVLSIEFEENGTGESQSLPKRVHVKSRSH
jgi:HSP20 family protein